VDIFKPTEETENGTKEGTRLKCRRDIARNAVGIGWRDAEVFLKTCASDCRANECAIIAKAESPKCQRRFMYYPSGGGYSQ
jgi:hypothetical protein